MEAVSKIEITTKANTGKRLIAGFIDYGIIILFQICMFYFFGESIESTIVLRGFPMLMIPIFWVVMTIGTEQFLGATLGNYLTDLKPVSIHSFGNQNVTLSQSIKRHLLDIIDLSFFGLIGFLLIKNTQYNQRLGDVWAKTIVINTQDKSQGINWSSQSK